MSSFDKVVKLACKPKPAPPKAKYLDPIIAATWSEDGAVHDVCKALVPRLREPNAIVVFKALIVLHTMIRNGATDNVLSHLSSSEVLRLRNVSAGNWEGYNAPQNMQLYALYLDTRIRAYRELKHDAIRAQAESNRDLRLNNSLEEDMAYTTAPPSKASSTKSKAHQRNKTVTSCKLRSMTVEKGLLRETKTVQKMIDSLVECRFYLDDLEDELTITALRMLVKDLLILFQAGNEGVINVLGHYFEMSRYDAEEALSIYRNFCSQTERVVEYLGVAKKLQNLLNVPVPTLKHAPVSLASSLQDYLNDPNFEQNRLEYKASRTSGSSKDRNGAPSAPGINGVSGTSATSTATKVSTKPPSPPLPGVSNKPSVDHAATDFFSSIEGDQASPFNPVTGSPTSNHFPQQTAHNPFVQRQITGAFTSQPFGGQVQIQSTGFPPPLPFAQPFQTAQPMPPPLVNSFPIQTQQTPQHRPFSTFIPQQATGPQPVPNVGFLQPQPTGANPFRQSMLIPQATGMPMFGSNGIPPIPPLPGSQPDSFFQLTSSLPLQPPGQPVAPPAQVQQPAVSSTQLGPNNPPSGVPARPASTPLVNTAVNPSSTSPPISQPVKSHQTGSRNPFGVPVTPAPPVPKLPTLLELSMGLGRSGPEDGQSAVQLQPTAVSSLQVQRTGAATESTFSAIASSFAFASQPQESVISPGSDLNSLGSPLNLQMTSATTSSMAPDHLWSPLTSQASNVTVRPRAPSMPLSSALKPQQTGFGGVKPFKPTSSFGASLLEALPPIPQSGTATPDPSAQSATHSSAPSLPSNLALDGPAYSSGVGKDGNPLGIINSQPTGAPLPQQIVNGGITVGVGLRPQATGALGGANPFRATMFASSSASFPAGGMSNMLVPSASTLPFAGLSTGTGTLPAFVPGFGGSAFNPSPVQFGQDGLNVQQQNAGASLI